MLELVYFMWGLLIFVAIVFCIFGIDEILFDIFYAVRVVYRKWKTRNYDKFYISNLLAVAEKKIAIMIPSWSEDAVIEEMLRYNLTIIEYSNYDIFIGTYGNDKLTQEAVARVQAEFPRLHQVTNPKDGPTTKGDNLNSIYSYIQKFEQENNVRYDIFVMNDSEDIIHPWVLKVFNYLIPRKDMVQIPIMPLEVEWKYFTHWTYNDEFAENHTKNLVIRESLKGLVPSAGTGTGFSRHAMEKLSEKNTHPFFTDLFTEDYNTALRIRLMGLKSIFVSQKVTRVQNRKKWVYFGELTPKPVEEFIAIRCLFPFRYEEAVKQRSRWVMGISLQEWQRTGWPGSFPLKYSLFADRKSLLSHINNALAYIVLLFWIGYFFWQKNHTFYPSLQEFLDRHPLIWILIIICTVFMLERMLQRIWAVSRFYGAGAALLSVPRIIYGNIINLHATLRAYWRFFTGRPSSSKLKWEKTKHIFPGANILKIYQRRLGDLIIENRILTASQITKALKEQTKTGKKLGEILLNTQAIQSEQLLKLLAKQHNLELVEPSKEKPLSSQDLSFISKDDYNWLLHHDMKLIKKEAQELTLALCFPEDLNARHEASRRLHPYKVKYVLSSDAVKV